MSIASLEYPVDDAPDEALTRREAGKAERRRRIIDAAREMIRETGNAGLSMRALAVRAGVSLATPYNLFGSKRAIVVAVLQDVREFHARFASQTATDPMERIFLAVDIAVDFYLDDPIFYRTLWAAVHDASDDVRTIIFNPRRDAFWLRLLGQAVELGELRPNIDVDPLLSQLEQCFRASMLAWVVGDITPAQLAPNMRLGYALMLAGAATEAARPGLEARIALAQAELRAGRNSPGGK